MSALALLALALCAEGTVDRAEGPALVVYARDGVRVVALSSLRRPLPPLPWEGLTLHAGCRLSAPSPRLERVVRRRLAALRSAPPRTGP